MKKTNAVGTGSTFWICGSRMIFHRRWRQHDFLEVAMIVIGLAAVIISFRISDKKVSNTAEVDMEANMQKFDGSKEELFTESRKAY